MSAIPDLVDLAAEQWGLITAAQARVLGVSPQALARLANQGTLERLIHGVYRVGGAPPSPRDELRAAWLTFDSARRANDRLRDESPVVISHRSASAMHELGDVEADHFEFTIGERKQTRRPDIRIHRSQVKPADWTIIDGLPVTTVVRTVDDLATAHIDGGHMAKIVRDALTRRQVGDEKLIDVLRHHARTYGAKPGDGEGLLSRFLQEAGISEPIKRAVALAETSKPGTTFEPRDRTNPDSLPNFGSSQRRAKATTSRISSKTGQHTAAQIRSSR